MLEFLASEWNEIIRTLDALESQFNLAFVQAVTSGERKSLIDPIQRVADGCILLGLNLSASYAEETIELIKNRKSLTESLSETLDALKVKPHDRKRGKLSDALGPEELRQEISILRKRIDDELKNRKFLAISPEKSRFYRNTNLFGSEVYDNFPSAREDIEEAGTCYACARSTASVFHLMRVIETGLRVLGLSLNNPDLDPKKNPSWNRILKPCDDELRKPLAQRCPEWKQDELFYSNATANLRAVKDAWRNPTMHVEINYDEERALEIINAVKAFMRHIATKLRE